MTPLAHRIVKQLTLPIKSRDSIIENTGFAKMLNGAVCFDVSAVQDMIPDIADKFRQQGVDESRAFLPAPVTWIEMGRDDGWRCGWLLVQSEDSSHAKCYGLLEQRLGTQTFWTPDARDDVPWTQLTEKDLTFVDVPLGDGLDDNHQRRSLALTAANLGLDSRRGFDVLAALAIINTPRIIGRRQHMPHRGLEKALTRQQKVIGRFPLRAWTEITLEATPKFTDDDGTEHEAHLTGRKCLHFCRAHLRVRNGRLELVNAHWRGDPALGIKRTRYRVAA